jgi:hypothetical protein
MTVICAVFIGMHIQRNQLMEFYKEEINKTVENYFSAVYGDLGTKDNYEFFESITVDYPDMTEEEKNIWFADNKEFYHGLENGFVFMSNLQKPYFYADNAGNNPVVQSITARYYEQYKKAGREAVIISIPYAVGEARVGTGKINQTFGNFLFEYNIDKVSWIKDSTLEYINNIFADR